MRRIADHWRLVRSDVRVGCDRPSGTRRAGPQRPIETGRPRISARLPATRSPHDLHRIAWDEVDQREHQRRDAEQHRHGQEHAPDEESGHGS
jgi:hypothetical protein